MYNFIKKIGLLLLLLSSALLFACSDDGDGSSTASKIWLSAVQKVAPEFEAASSRAINENWADGNPTYELYKMLQKFSGDINDQTVGNSNIFKVMTMADMFYSMSQESGTSITSQTITSPFDFDKAGSSYLTMAGIDANDEFAEIGEFEYDKVYSVENYEYGNMTIDSYMATKNDNGTYYALITWGQDRSDGKEYGVMQAKYNSGNGNVQIHTICYVDYISSNDYAMRSDIVGNTESHEFKIRIAKHNAGTNFRLSVAGAGVSEGTGKMVFLARAHEFNIENNLTTIHDILNDGSGAGAAFFGYDTSADESTLQANRTDDGNAITDLDAAYQEIYNTSPNSTVLLKSDGAHLTDVTNDAGSNNDMALRADDFTGAGTFKIKPTDWPN